MKIAGLRRTLNIYYFMNILNLLTKKWKSSK